MALASYPLHGPLGLHRLQSISHKPLYGLAVQEWKVTRDLPAVRKTKRCRVASLIFTRIVGTVAVMTSPQGEIKCLSLGK